MTLKQRGHWLYWDAMFEGSSNPLLRVYYRLRMRIIEWKSRKEGQ